MCSQQIQRSGDPLFNADKQPRENPCRVDRAMTVPLSLRVKVL